MKTFSTAILLGLFGAAAVAVSFKLQWPTWVMFIAWVSYYLFGKSWQTSLLPFIQIILGIIMGILIQSGGKWISSFAGALGLPIAVFFFIGSLAYISRFTKLHNIPAWFLGLIIFFGVHPPVDFIPVASLLVPVTAGFLFAWLNDTTMQKLIPAKTTH